MNVLETQEFEKKLLDMTNEAIEAQDLAATAVPLQILSYVNGAYTVNANIETVNTNLVAINKTLQAISLQLSGLDSKLQTTNSSLGTISSRLSSVVTAVQSIDKKTV